MKKVTFLLFLALGIQVALVRSTDKPTYLTNFIQVILPRYNNPNLNIFVKASQEELCAIIDAIHHAKNNGMRSQDIAYTIDRLIQGNGIVDPVEDTLKTGSYEQLFDFLETNTLFEEHLKCLKTHFKWAHYKHIPLIVCMTLIAFMLFFQRGMLETYIHKISNTPHGQNFIRNSIALLTILPLAYKTYSYYKDASIIKNTASILKKLKTNTLIRTLKEQYCPKEI